MFVYILFIVCIMGIFCEYFLHIVALIYALYNCTSMAIWTSMYTSFMLTLISLIGGNLIYIVAYQVVRLSYTNKQYNVLHFIESTNSLYACLTDITIVFFISQVPSYILQMIISICVFNIFAKITFVSEVHDSYISKYLLLSNQYHNSHAQITDIVANDVFNNTKYLITKASIELIDETFILKDILHISYLSFIHDTTSSLDISTMPVIYAFIFWQLIWYMVSIYINNNILNNLVRKICKIKSY